MAKNDSEEKRSKKYLAGLSLAAIGIVYGDIGTSPLYAFRESFHEQYGMPTTHANVLGILSLIFWALIFVITIKYLIYVLKADIKGEGGVLVLTALITPRNGKQSKIRSWLIIGGLLGASLLYGDGMITPAISVLSAVEGLKVATPVFQPYIIPITIGIILALFFFQSHGTAGLGKVFGPIITVWFLTLAGLGVSQIINDPAVFKALNPWWGLDYFARNGVAGFLVLGSVFLVVTGGEALYTDMGHFGILPIRISWFGLVLPCLVINYFGQGALLLQHPAAVENPFFLMAPSWLLYPVVIIATMATIIASQAVIAGVFSLTRQAIQFGYVPRMKVEQTSTKEVGQVYMPGINWVMMIACIGLVVGFGSSSNLAAAYGVGVTTTMVFTSLLFAVVLRKRWNWSLLSTGLLISVFLVVDLSFFLANIIKVPEGGWFPLVVAFIILAFMTTWKKGREILGDRLESTALALEKFMGNISSYADIDGDEIKRVNGTAVYMYSNPKSTPPAMLHNIKHNRVIHKNVIILRVKNTDDEPYVRADERIEVEELGNGFYRFEISNGFAQSVNIPYVLKNAEFPNLKIEAEKVTYFLGKESILPNDSKNSKMAKWRDHLFGIMVRNQQPATKYFNLPANRVVEIGAQVEL